MSKAISRRDFMKVPGAVGAAGLLAACGGNSAASGSAASTASSAPAASADESLALSDGPVSMTISWWGGDSRHEAYQNAIKEFQAEHTNITIEPTFAAWSGWEEKMAAAFIAGNAQDVCQVNWNWLYNYSADGSKFVDLNTVSKFLDLTQWDDAAMDACYVANSQQCVPVSMTGRIFFWNMTTFNKAGITEVPKSLDDLMAAGKAFKEKLGDDYYPMHLGAYDRMILMVFYLESKYGKDWADPVTSTLNYTEDEIAEGIDFIKSLVDGHVMMNLKTYYSANSDTLPTSPTSGSPVRSQVSSSGIPLLPSTPPLWMIPPRTASPLAKRSSSATTTAASPRSPWVWPSPRPASALPRLLP